MKSYTNTQSKKTKAKFEILSPWQPRRVIFSCISLVP